MNNIETVTFNNSIRTVSYIDTKEITDITIKEIPQCYRYNAFEALVLYNETLNTFIDICIKDMRYSNFEFQYTSLDSRVHMLKPSMLPCIGGWHCDDFYRGDNNQPLLKDIDTKCPQRHYICTIGNTSLPQFIIPSVTLEIDKDAVYKSLNKEIQNQHLDFNDGCDVYQPKSGEVIQVGPSAIHRGIPADKASWRVFMRLTFSHHREPKNEIRTQTQVYLTNTNGW